jgi:hypothetical protein
MHPHLLSQCQHQHGDRPEGGQVARLLGILLDHLDQLIAYGLGQFVRPPTARLIVQPGWACHIEASHPLAHRLVFDIENASDLGHRALLRRE